MIMRRTVEDLPPVVIGPTEPPSGGGVPWIYTLESKVQWTLPRIGPEHDFKDMFDGEILRRRLHMPPEIAGRFLAIRIRTDDAHDAGVAVPEVFGAIRPQLMPFYRALFDARTDELKRSVRDRFEVHGLNVLLLYSVLVLADHRGQGLGLATASRLIETLGGGCTLAACRPFPAQFSPPLADREFHDAMRLDDFTRNRRLATRRIRDHVSQLGFRRVGKSSVFALRIDPGYF